MKSDDINMQTIRFLYNKHKFSKMRVGAIIVLLATVMLTVFHVFANKSHINNTIHHKKDCAVPHRLQHNITVQKENSVDTSFTWDMFISQLHSKFRECTIDKHNWLDIMCMMQYYMNIFHIHAELTETHMRDNNGAEADSKHLQASIHHICTSRINAITNKYGVCEMLNKFDFFNLVNDLYNMLLRFKRTDYYQTHMSAVNIHNVWTYSEEDVRIMLNIHDVVDWKSVMCVVNSASACKEVPNVSVSSYKTNFMDVRNRIYHSIYLILTSYIFDMLNSKFDNGYVCRKANDMYDNTQKEMHDKYTHIVLMLNITRNNLALLLC